MPNRRLRVILPVLVLAVGALLAILSSISGSALNQAPRISSVAHASLATPTPVPTPTSVPGSTDGIMWMGAVIVFIILVPILLNKSTWTRP